MKYLDKLVMKAEEEGFANVNGRMWDEWSQGHGPLQSKASVKLEGNALTVTHWGTIVLTANLFSGNITGYYGQSATDREIINYFINLYRLESTGGAHYYPSKDLFLIDGVGEDLCLVLN